MFSVLAFSTDDPLLHEWAALYADDTEPVEGGLVLHLSQPHSFQFEKFAAINDIRYGLLSGQPIGAM